MANLFYCVTLWLLLATAVRMWTNTLSEMRKFKEDIKIMTLRIEYFLPINF